MLQRILTFVFAASCAAILGASASPATAAEPSVFHKSDRNRPHVALPDSVHAHIAESLDKKQSVDEHFPKVGGTPEPENFVDLCEIGGVLLGFDLCFGQSVFNQAVITAYRPYYLTQKGKQVGKWRGYPSKNFTHLEAKPGYVVGSVKVQGGVDFNNLTVRYMKLTDKGIDPNDAYDSLSYGGTSKFSTPVTIGGGGRMIIGLGGLILAIRSVPNFGGVTVPAMPK